MALRLDNQPNTVFERQFDELENGKIEFAEFTRGTPKQNRRKTVWNKLQPGAIASEFTESYDGGETSQVNGKVQLTKNK